MNAPLPSTGWCLRFLSGAMKGRTIALKPGPNQLGSSGDCDVMLPGGDVLPRHLMITVGDLVVSVQRIATASFALNHEDVQQARRSVMVGDVLSIGAIDLQLEPTFPAAKAEDPIFATPEGASPDAAPPPRDFPRGTGFRVGAGLLVVSIVALLSLAIWAGGAGRPAVDTSRASLAAVQRAIVTFSEVQVVAQPGGQIAVRGFVESPARKQALLDAVAPFGDRVEVAVYAVNELIEQARRYVGAPGIAIDYVGEGRLVVSGASDDENIRQKLRRMGEDLHPSVIVSDKVQYRPGPVADPNADLRTQWAMWQQMLPARLVSITESEDGMRSIQLANGSRYYEGSVLKSGAELRRIDAGGIELFGGTPAPSKK